MFQLIESREFEFAELREFEIVESSRFQETLERYLYPALTHS